ncbi:MAG: hypothetical protein M3313_03500 [Actinomycetota bacterium]|nr:hypothetical protein [Actinomycetota bacterium]
MTSFVAAVCGAVAFAGIAVVVAGWNGALPDVTGPRPVRKSRDLTRRVALGVSGLLLGFLFTRWPVAAVYIALGGAGFPSIVRSKRERREAIEKMEAIATWTESLKDIMGVGAGLHNTLQLSARTAPAPIETEVRNLSIRLQHESVDVALIKFAADVAHPAADTVVASLLLASRLQAGGLPDVLASVARATRDAAAMKQRIEGSRERAYTQSRIVAGTSIAFILLLVVFRRDFLSPYDTIGGQIAQAIIGGTFAFSGYAMYKLGRPQVPMRVFGRLERMGRAPVTGTNQR